MPDIRTPDRAADWISVTAALELMLREVAPLPLESVPLAAAHGRVLGEPVISPIDAPAWDNSGMDGYAAHAADVRGASAERPIRLRLAASIPAGAFPRAALQSGTVVKVMTGAPVPAGADSVIRLEHTRAVDAEHIEIIDDCDCGRNIRPQAEDMRAGETVVRAGSLLRAAEIGVLASVGAVRVAVHRTPEVAVLSTGDELVDVTEFAQVRAGRRIVDSNSCALAAGLQDLGCRARPLGIARDQEKSLRKHLERALDADALITSAGASMGEHDLVKDVLERLGFALRFWRVRMRPGSPFSYGVLERRGAPPLPVFGLPGNPVSATVTFEVLVKPVLRRMLGRNELYPRTLAVRTAEPIPSKRGLMHFLRVRLEQDGRGEWLARLTGAQGSGMLTSLVRADALLIVPETRTGLELGERALALPLPGIDAAQMSPRFEMEEV